MNLSSFSLFSLPRQISKNLTQHYIFISEFRQGVLDLNLVKNYNWLRFLERFCDAGNEKSSWSTVKTMEPATLISGFITNNISLVNDSCARLESEFGEIEFRSQTLDFNFTDYYTEEFGKDLKRVFISFKNLIDPKNLADIKTFTNTLEKKFQVDGARKINIDPGYVQLGKLVLATTKDQQHRIYLGNLIYAEVTLRFCQNTFTTWPWTYPDYQTPQYIEIFNHIRELHYKKIKPGKKKSG